MFIIHNLRTQSSLSHGARLGREGSAHDPPHPLLDTHPHRAEGHLLAVDILRAHGKDSDES